jgi:ABC-type lipoprotein export system ATPase subunit
MTFRALPILKLVDVTKDYVSEGAPVRAVDGVSLEAERGQMIALVGRSGCGKSTLLNLAGAIDMPTSGEVWIDGVRTTDLDDARLTALRRNRIGFIFQSFQLLPTLSVIENVELPLMLAGRSDARTTAMEQLAAVELETLAHRMPYQLSGGQMQRVAIARALTNQPSLLLADEPTGNLDSTTGDHILELLSKIAREHQTTILLATHSPEAATASDLIVRLRDGRVESVRTPDTCRT